VSPWAVFLALLAFSLVPAAVMGQVAAGETPPAGVAEAPLAESPGDGSEDDRVRKIFERDDLLPPPYVQDHRDLRSLKVQAFEHFRNGMSVRTEMFQIQEPDHRRHRLLDLDGETLSFVTARDLNDDGYRELFVGVSPPRQLETKRFLVFSYNALDEVFVKIFESDSIEKGVLRFIPMGERDKARAWAVALDDPKGARSSRQTRIYRMVADELTLVKTVPARPLDPYDKVLWAREALGTGDWDRGVSLAQDAVGSAEGDMEMDAQIVLIRSLLAAGNIDLGRSLLDRCVGSKTPVANPGTPPADSSGNSDEGHGAFLRTELDRLHRLCIRKGVSKDELRECARLEAFMRSEQPVRADRLARSFYTDHPSSPLLDEVLMLHAQALIAAGYESRALDPLTRLVLEHPSSEHHQMAQDWVVQLQGAASSPGSEVSPSGR